MIKLVVTRILLLLHFPPSPSPQSLFAFDQDFELELEVLCFVCLTATSSWTYSPRNPPPKVLLLSFMLFDAVLIIVNSILMFCLVFLLKPHIEFWLKIQFFYAPFFHTFYFIQRLLGRVNEKWQPLLEASNVLLSYSALLNYHSLQIQWP